MLVWWRCLTGQWSDIDRHILLLPWKLNFFVVGISYRDENLVNLISLINISSFLK